MNRIAVAILGAGVALGCSIHGSIAAEQGERPAPMTFALTQMVSEGTNREASALVQVYALRAQLEDAERRLKEAVERAEKAEKQRAQDSGGSPSKDGAAER